MGSRASFAEWIRLHVTGIRERVSRFSRSVFRSLRSMPQTIPSVLAIFQRRIHGYIHLVLLRHAGSLLSDTFKEGVRAVLGRPIVLPAICAFLGSNAAFFLPLSYAVVAGLFLFLIFLSLIHTAWVGEAMRQRALLILIASLVQTCLH